MASESYDKATQILRTRFPDRAKADAIVARQFPFFGAAARIVAGASLVPGSRQTDPVARTTGGPLSAGGRGIYPGERIARGPAVRSVAADLIAKDAASSGAAGEAVVDIRVWAAKLGSAGVETETIYGAYEDAGGDPVLSAQQQAGQTGEFLAGFVGALEGRGVSPEVVLGTYQQAGGRIGK